MPLNIDEILAREPRYAGACMIGAIPNNALSDIHKNAKRNAALVIVLREALSGLYELCLHARPDAFSNGNKDSTGSIDEGEVIASSIMDAAEKALDAADELMQESGVK